MTVEHRNLPYGRPPVPADLLQAAQARDGLDPLAAKRKLFRLPEHLTYLDGNSLGALSEQVVNRLTEVSTRQWGEDLIAGWNDHDWISLPTRIGDRLGALMGAQSGQVLCCDNLSSNLFKLLVSGLTLNPERRVVVSERSNFPSDNYVLQGLLTLLGPERIEIRLLDAEEISNADFSDVAIVMLTHVDFRTGRKYDLLNTTRRVQDGGALMLWDLAHSLGVCDLELDRANVDMAVGCTYKFVNAGPGAPGFLFLAERHIAQSINPVAGWMGHADLFAFDPDYRPAPGIERFLTGTPSVLALSAVDAAIDAHAQVSPKQLEEKAESLTGFMLEQRARMPALADLNCPTPADGRARGAQVSLRHPEAYAVTQALINRGVIVDFREPDIIRFGFSPLYNTHIDAARALVECEQLLASGGYLEQRFQVRKKVT